MSTLPNFASKQEWLNWRGIGSSDAPVIMRVSPWKTPYQLWEEMVLGSGTKDNSAMKRGREMEPKALEWFEKKIGMKMVPQVCLSHRSHNWMTATIDGINEEKKVMVEIKCPSKKSTPTQVPEIYYPQLQHQLEVKGYDGMYYCHFDGEDGVILEVGRDQKYIDSLLKEEEAFNKNVIEMEPPSLIERDWQQMQDVPGWYTLANRWQSIDQSLKSLEKEEKQLRQEMIALAAGRNVMGCGIKMTRSLSKGAVDYDLIPELKGVDREKYRKPPFEKWRFSPCSNP